ncbi:MAG: hypothetical protein EOM25_10545 [Deltaproteobacteria bacterium]|nr:hypothetical protein [Deltaproteobacteria bacterium]
MKSDALRSFDPRIKIFLTVFFGIMVWRMPTYLLGGWVLGLSVLFLAVRRRRSVPGFSAAIIVSLALWVAVKFCLDILDSGIGLEASALGAGLLALRMTFLLLWGGILIGSTCMAEVGPAVVWMLRPVCGSRAWKVGAGLGVMLQTLPRIRQAAHEVRQASRVRLPALGRFRSASAQVVAVTRVMASGSWNQALALSARNLDGPWAWTPAFPFRPCQWLTGVILVAGTVAGSFWV